MQKIWKFYWKNERNGEHHIWYQWFKAFEINNLYYSNMFSFTTFPWADRRDDEFNQIMKVGGAPGVARVIITLSRIMVLVKLEYYVIMCMKIANPLLHLLNHRNTHKNCLIFGISGIAWVIIAFAKIMLLIKIKLC